MNKEHIKVNALKSANSYKEFANRLKLKNNSDIIEELFSALDIITSKYNHNGKSVFELSYKIISFIKNLVLYDEVNKEEIIDKITIIKTKLIEKIKLVDKKDRVCNYDVINYKDIVNSVEKLELALLYDNINDNSLRDASIVNDIIFCNKEINPSKYLISKYPYIINSFSNSCGNIVNLVVNHYLDILKKLVNGECCLKTELFYFDNILEEIFKNKKIKVDDEVKSYNINKVLRMINYDNSISYNLWLKNILYILNGKCNMFTSDEIDYMYDTRHSNFNNYDTIIVPKKVVSVSDYIISIDNDETIVRDDSFSINVDNNGNYILKIFIADPNRYFSIDSLLMKDVRKKCETIYYDDYAKHMLPVDLINDYLSLNQGMIRPARVYEFYLDRNANVICFNINKTFINVNHNFTYSEADNIIKNGSKNYNLDRSFYLVLSLLDSISKSDTCNILLKSPNNSMSLISNLMSFNNIYVASYFKSNKLPFVYRGQTIYKDLKFLNISDYDYLKDDIRVIIDKIDNISMNPFYSIDPINHNGLGIDCYTTVTSPLRKYADILANYCEDWFYFSKDIKDENKKIDFIKSEINYINDRHIEIEQHYKKRKREEI